MSITVTFCNWILRINPIRKIHSKPLHSDYPRRCGSCMYNLQPLQILAHWIRICAIADSARFGADFADSPCHSSRFCHTLQQCCWIWHPSTASNSESSMLYCQYQLNLLRNYGECAFLYLRIGFSGSNAAGLQIRMGIWTFQRRTSGALNHTNTSCMIYT